MVYDSILDLPGQKRDVFIKYLVIGGALGALIGIFFFIMNNQVQIGKNPIAIEIIVASIIIILVGIYLINKSKFDII
jgi:sulfite exporter TauE/SafE